VRLEQKREKNLMFIRNALLSAALSGLVALPAAAQDAPVLGYQLYGTGPEKVVTLHNWMGDATSFDAIRPWIDTDAFTFAFADVRGCGASRAIEGAYTSDEIAADVLRLADHLGWDHFHLVGHSMNGMAGFKTVMRDHAGSRRIKSFVAITPVTPDGYPASNEDRAFLWAAIDDDKTAKDAFAGLTGGKLNATWAERNTDYLRLTASPTALRGYYRMWLEEDFSEAFRAAGVTVPILVIGGRNDLPGFQEAYYAETVAKWAPDIRFAYIDDAGHFPIFETPALTAALIESHLRANH